jgi:hypothetical protein
VFFISHDDQFMIKTMHKEEIKLLLRCATSLAGLTLACLKGRGGSVPSALSEEASFCG